MLESGLLRITDEDGVIFGTGFLVSKTHVLTCAHVVCAALGIESTTKDLPNKMVRLSFPFFPGSPKHFARAKAWYPAKEVITFNELEDIVLLQLKSDPDQEGFFPKGAKPLELAPNKSNVATKFKVCGFPKGVNYGETVEIKLLESDSEFVVPIESVSANKSIVSGFSGAPVWSESSQEVFGMVVSRKTEFSGMKEFHTYMIPVRSLRVHLLVWAAKNDIKLFSSVEKSE